MASEPFPDRGPDGEESDGSGPPPAEGNGPEGAGRWSEDDRQGPGQGLFVCLPAEQLTLAGFAEGGPADTMAPGPLLATVVHAVTGEDGAGLAHLSDDQLIGIISAARRMESRAAWTQMAAIREFAARRPAHSDRAGQSTAVARVSEFAADELAGEFNLTWQSAAEQMAYACAVAQRLPRTFAALAAGKVHPVAVKIIEDETRILSPEDAAEADEVLAQAGQDKSFGQLRYAAHRLVLRLDPDAARRRRETARQDAHVRRFREDSGNAGMVARELPPDEVLASWQHVEQRALDLRAAGLPGTLQELRVRAYLDLLQERDSRSGPGIPDTGQASSPQGPESNEGPGGPPDGNDGSGGNGGSGPSPQGGPAGTGPDGRACHDSQGTGPSLSPGTGPSLSPGIGLSLAALVTITAPIGTLLGQSDEPAEVGGFGLVDARTARDLVTAASMNPHTRWCVTALHPDGTAAAHGCARGQHSAPPGTVDLTATCGNSPGPDPPPGMRPQEYLRGLRIRMIPIARGRCDHAQAEAGYQPSRKLEHLIGARSTRCTAPACSRPAARCDKDHTIAWHNGGLTCECNLAPLCRHHHRCKQAEGWWLEQPEPGVLKCRTPAGRTYTTTPTSYTA
jgi:hypothetical protein